MSGSFTRSWDASSRIRNLSPAGRSPGVRAVAIAFVLLAASLVHAQQPSVSPEWPVLGWQGSYVVGAWTEATLELDIATAGRYEVRVTAPDPDGHPVTTSSLAELVPGRQLLHGYFKAGQLDPEIEIQVVAVASGETVWSWTSTTQSPPVASPLTPGSRLIVTVGNPPGFDQLDSRPVEGRVSAIAAGETFHAIPVSTADLPVDARAYGSVTLLVISRQSVLSVAQSNAVRDWVSQGGRIAISLPGDLDAARSVIQPLAGWLPATLAAEPATVSEFGKLEFFAGKNVRIPFTGRMRIPGVRTIDGEVLAGSRDEALLVRTSYGLGTATLLALDLTKPPLSRWSELPSLCRRLVETAPETAGSTGGGSRNMQLSSTGITDMATQLHAVQEDFAGIQRASPWLAMGLLAAFLLVIGPLDYLIVHRLLRRPRGTWLTFPVWVAAAAVLCTNLAASWNGSSVRINQLNLVNYDVRSSTCHQRMWTNIYSPATQRRTVAVGSALARGDFPSAASHLSSWSGVAETAYGGMLRPGGVRVGRADYRLQGDATVDGLPLLQWSSKPLLTEIHAAAGKLVESDLQSNGVGQLSGTVIQRFPGPIEDWFLAFGNRVYRHKKTRDDAQSLPLAPGQVLRIDQPGMYPRELRGFLTGKIVTGTRTPGSLASDVANRYIEYDPLSRNPADILKILTFHHEVGGSKYTGLTNRLLEAEDLSHMLKLGRAILFGRLKATVADVRLDGVAAVPDREVTFVRVILPVKKVGSEINRSLERLDQ